MGLQLSYAIVRGMEDVQSNFEQIQADAVGISELSVTSARLAVLTALGISRGTGSLTTRQAALGPFGSGAQYTYVPVTVNHGLGHPPISVGVTGANGLNGGFTGPSLFVVAGSVDATSFQVGCSVMVYGSSFPGTVDFSWQAVL
jgi:hypothetical protein